MSPLYAKAGIEVLGSGPAANDPKRAAQTFQFSFPTRPFDTLIVVKDECLLAAQDNAPEEPQAADEREDGNG
jgi:hypothetical protein